MKNLFNFADLSNKKITTEDVVNELEKAANALFRMSSDTVEGYRMISKVWMEICRTKHDIMCVNDDKHTAVKLYELEKNIQFIKMNIA